MRNALAVIALGVAGAYAAPADAHALFPSSQTVMTMGERAFVRFEASNGRDDVSDFIVEIFEGGTWTPSRIAITSTPRLTIPKPARDSLESTNRTISVLVDLDGKPEQKLRVCTKTAPPRRPFQPRSTFINSRVCSSVIVRKLVR